MAAPTNKIYSLRPSPATTCITNQIYQDFIEQIDEAISSSDFSSAEKAVRNHADLIKLGPNHLEYLQKQGSFYSVLIKYVSEAQYDMIVTFLSELQQQPNSELFMTDEIFLCYIACLLSIDAAGYQDKCADMIQDRLLKSPDLYQHFDTLMLSDHQLTEFYRPIAPFFKQ